MKLRDCLNCLVFSASVLVMVMVKLASIFTSYIHHFCVNINAFKSDGCSIYPMTVDRRNTNLIDSIGLMKRLKATPHLNLMSNWIGSSILLFTRILVQ